MSNPQPTPDLPPHFDDLVSGREAARCASHHPVSLETLYAMMQQILAAVERMPQGSSAGESRPPLTPALMEIPPPLAPTAMTLAEHWQDLGVTTSQKPTGPNTQHLWEVAKFLGDYYPVMGHWYQVIKRAVQQGQHARLDLTKDTRDTRDTICRFNRLLYNFGLATETNYFKLPTPRVRMTPHLHPSTMPFLLGGWLEDYIAYQLAVATGYGTIARNLLVQLTPGQQVELDALWYGPSTLAILECKTNDYQASLPKLQLISQYLRPTHLFVVVVHKPHPDVVQQFAQAYGIRLVTLQEVPRVLSQLAHPQPAPLSVLMEGTRA